MREILFRGKSTELFERGRWVYGFYENEDFNEVYQIPCSQAESHYIVNQDDTVEVDPSTVGQYTGLQDKNGKRIFEGDIVADGDDIYVCFWDGCNVEFGVKNKDLSFGIAYLPITEHEVIGNIHDNPELLEVDHED